MSQKSVLVIGDFARKSPQTNNIQYWLEGSGWVSLDQASRYPADKIQEVKLPAGGVVKWLHLADAQQMERPSAQSTTAQPETPGIIPNCYGTDPKTGLPKSPLAFWAKGITDLFSKR